MTTIKPHKAHRKSAKPTWWTLTIGDHVTYNGLSALVTSIGRNNGENTIVHIQIPTIAKSRKVRMKELS